VNGDPTKFAEGKSFQIDLVAASKKLIEKDPIYRPFRGLVEQAVSAESASADLDRCKQAVRALKAIIAQNAPTRIASADEGVVVGALFSEAVITYTRATQTSEAKNDAGRTKVGLYEAIPKSLLPKHEQFMALRNGSIAHFGVGVNHLSGAWAKETLVFASPGGDIPPFIILPNIRMNANAEVIQDLDDLLDGVYPKIREIAEARNQQVGIALLKLYQADRRFREVALDSQFDPLAFYNGDEQSAHLWELNLAAGRITWESSKFSKKG